MLLWKFERSVLRPLQIAPLLVAVPCLVAKEWWALLACAIFAFLVGGIGQSIHPLQSAKNLAQGPTQSRAAVLEAATLDISAQSALVQRACTKVAMLIGATLFSALLAYGDLRWYWAVPVSWAVMIFSGAVLKMRFARESLSL